ncbi:MAG: phosphate signaling complex protein PhoU [Myxococcales bacterium]|nr:phosphate signaling complex protein PhoU [Myxococcales bacterium]
MKRVQKEINLLKKRILELGGLVEERVYKASQAYEQRDPELAREVINGDFDIDQLEVDLEEDCLKVLALYQPVAVDLRYIIAILKINNDLERIGDLAANLASRAAYLAQIEPLDVDFDFAAMSERVKTMLHKSLDSLVNTDAQAAYEVFLLDDAVDEIHHTTYRKIEVAMVESPTSSRALINLLGISKTMERIADLATNIAEDVVYLTEGEIVRHRAWTHEATVHQLHKEDGGPTLD